MELRQLELFLAVAEELHFGRAARRVHLSQPALTQAIARFEREIGARLFDRTSRRVELTPAGAALVDRARSMLADADSTADLVARTARGELGVVRIGVVGTAMVSLLPALVRQTRAKHPALELQLTEATGARQLDDLRAGRLDLGLLHADEAALPTGVELRLVSAEPLAVALPADHRLAARGELRLPELRDEPVVLIAPEREADTSSLYLAACTQAGFSPKIAAHVTSLQALLGFVAAGLGWAFVAKCVAENLHRDQVTYVPLRDTTARLPTAVTWPTGHLTQSAARVRDIAAPRTT